MEYRFTFKRSHESEGAHWTQEIKAEHIPSSLLADLREQALCSQLLDWVDVGDYTQFDLVLSDEEHPDTWRCVLDSSNYISDFSRLHVYLEEGYGASISLYVGDVKMIRRMQTCYAWCEVNNDHYSRMLNTYRYNLDGGADVLGISMNVNGLVSATSKKAAAKKVQKALSETLANFDETQIYDW